MENYKLTCKRLKLDYKKDLSIVLTVCLVLLIAAILLSIFYSIALGFIIIVLALAYSALHFSELKSKERQLVNAKEIAFNGFYRYVVALLKNGNILYSSLQSSLEYVDEVLFDDVNQLLVEIEEDTSLDPFLKFMESFNDETIKQMIMLLYKSQDVGVIDEVLVSINECMVNLQDNSINNYVAKEQKVIEKYFMWPILLSAAIIIVVTMYVFSMIGDGIYV